jgi:hypothetical protein
MFLGAGARHRAPVHGPQRTVNPARSRSRAAFRRYGTDRRSAWLAVQSARISVEVPAYLIEGIVEEVTQRVLAELGVRERVGLG